MSDTTGARMAGRRMLFAWLWKISVAYGVPFHVLPFVAREEKGEKNGRWHWHVLIGGLYHVAGRGVIPSPNPKADQHRLCALWKQCGEGAGRVESREYNMRLSGVQYVLKGLETSDFDLALANAYELTKFDDDYRVDRELISAPVVFRHLGRRSRNRRHQKAREVKIPRRDRSNRGVQSRIPSPVRPHPTDEYETRGSHKW